MADVITRLKVESSEYDAKIKRAQQGLLNLESSLKKSGKSFADADAEQIKYVRSLVRMETVSNTAKGKINELSQAFTELSMQYKRMSDQEKSGAYGKALSKSLDELKGRINDAKGQLADVNKELNGVEGTGGQLGGVLDQLGSKFGINTQMLSGLTTGTAAAAAGIGALAVAVAAATKEWADYNNELAKQQQITSVTTGLSGSEADNVTASARALAKIYGVDFREVINAANTLMTQFGHTGQGAIQLIADGMQGMIEGDGGKLLSMIQQYAPTFRDAGIEASQLVAIIQNSEGGLFTDQNMQAIVMGIRNIRLMTDSTAQSLAQLGIDGKKMASDVANGSMSVFDALQRVAGAVENVDSNSQAAGQVMQSVFGRQGLMSGTKLGEAIAQLNTNLSETKQQTGEVGKATADLARQQMLLEQEIAKVFGVADWKKMGLELETELVSELRTVVRGVGDFIQMLKDVDAWFDNLAGSSPWGKMAVDIALIVNPLTTVYGVLREIKDIYDALTGGDKKQKWAYNSLRGPAGRDKTFHHTTTTPAVVVPTITTRKGGGHTTTTAAKVSTPAPFGSEEFFNQQISALKKSQSQATNTASWKSYAEAIDFVTIQLKALKGELSDLPTTTEASNKEFAKAFGAGMLEDFRKQAKEIEDEQKQAAHETAQAWSTVAGAISTVGGALAGLEDPAAKVMGIVAQAIATIALTFAKSLKGTFTPWDWIAAAATGTATMISTISAIKSATAGSYAEGGIVPGNNHSDGLLAAVSSGEVILNAAQQDTLASQLMSAGSAMYLEAVVSGEQLRFVLNNNSRRRSRGEYVTTLMRN